ncbi:hypothetical protein KUG88_18900 [Rhodococcus rhodochrous]|uniref:hypothetical protein n=1 Tax=Rhodococcus rhodochrous TaxID=1829 RepID=UPI001E57BC65|nr:hypothetical protein [Rhodococcus rhodochrous]MCB8912198.1 hypothetical protein [Rhodococcus rhodochrous]
MTLDHAAAMRTASRLLINDHFARTAEDPDLYAANVQRLITGAAAAGDLEAIVYGLLDVLADADTLDAHHRLVHRAHAVAYADGDELAAHVLGQRRTNS